MRITAMPMLALSFTHLTPGQAAEIKRLEEKLMAPCCYTQTIRDHMSDIAEQMREEVTEFVVAGTTEQQILGFYKAKYGEAILVVPDGLSGRLVFGVPILLFLLSGSTLYLVLARSRRNSAGQAGSAMRSMSEAQLLSLRKRIRAELGE